MSESHEDHAHYEVGPGGKLVGRPDTAMTEEQERSFDARRRRMEDELERLRGVAEAHAAMPPAAEARRRKLALTGLAPARTLTEFSRDLSNLLNRYARESASDTPDFLLANYMLRALEAAEELILAREGWYGAVLAPGVRSGTTLKTEDGP